VLGLSLIFAAKGIFALGDLPANVIGYGFGLLMSFVLNRRWTFVHKGKIFTSVCRFGVAFGTAYSLNLATVFGLRDIARVDAYAAQAMGVIPYMICFYLISARYVFPEYSKRSTTSETAADEING